MLSPGLPLLDRILLDLEPRIYLNGFPKSGLHLAEQMIKAMSRPAQDQAWLGNLGRAAWKLYENTTPAEIEQAFHAALPGTYYKGHMYYRDDISEMLDRIDIATFLVIRDMRDVVVSQAFHVTSDDDRLIHFGKHIYKALPTFEDVLIAVIEGIDDYPGIFERWQYFGLWLGHPRLYLLRFESMRYNAYSTALDVALWLAKRVGGKVGMDPDMAEVRRRAKVAADNMGHREQSTTFRRGISRQWEEHFTDRVKDSFKRHSDGWLRWLGYERDDSW